MFVLITQHVSVILMQQQQYVLKQLWAKLNCNCIQILLTKMSVKTKYAIIGRIPNAIPNISNIALNLEMCVCVCVWVFFFFCFFGFFGFLIFRQFIAFFTHCFFFVCVCECVCRQCPVCFVLYCFFFCFCILLAVN